MNGKMPHISFLSSSTSKSSLNSHAYWDTHVRHSIPMSIGTHMLVTQFPCLLGHTCSSLNFHVYWDTHVRHSVPMSIGTNMCITQFPSLLGHFAYFTFCERILSYCTPIHLLHDPNQYKGLQVVPL